MSPLWSNHVFNSLSLKIQLETNICQVINYIFIKTIKCDPTFGESSIYEKQFYQIRRNIWQDVNYNFTESRQSKLGEIWFSVVQIPPCTLQCSILHLVVVQFLTWFNRHREAFYRFQWHCCACGAVIVNLFVVVTTLEFALDNTYQPPSRIQFR